MNMMEAKNIVISEAKTETNLFAGRPEKRLSFRAKIGEEVWEFDLRLSEGEMWVDGLHRTYPWLSCYVTRGEGTIRAGEIPFDKEVAEQFAWEPELDVPDFLGIFLKEWSEYGENPRFDEEFAIEAALDEAIRRWGERVAKSLED